jgi:hypothetical protein
LEFLSYLAFFKTRNPNRFDLIIWNPFSKQKIKKRKNSYSVRTNRKYLFHWFNNQFWWLYQGWYIFRYIIRFNDMYFR